VVASTGSLVFNDDPHKTLVANNTESIANTPDRQAVSSSPTGGARLTPGLFGTAI
jgi:hypothetical protein